MTLKKSQSSDPEADTLVLGLVRTVTEAKGRSVPSLENMTRLQESCRGEVPMECVRVLGRIALWAP